MSNLVRVASQSEGMDPMTYTRRRVRLGPTDMFDRHLPAMDPRAAAKLEGFE